MTILRMTTAGGITSATRYATMLAGNEAYVPGDFVSIATASGNGSGTSVTFSNIPQTFKHLQLRSFAKTANAAAYDVLYLYNYDGTLSNTNSAYHGFYGTGSAVGTTSGTAGFSGGVAYIPAANSGANIFGTSIVDIVDYSSTIKNKTIRAVSGFDDNTVTSGNINLYLGSVLPVALGTTAITSLTIVTNGAINSNSRFALYGIK